MESLEGKRGYPRIRPPFPAVVGLYGCPTVINNVETLSTVPAIIRGGGEWYAGLGTPRNGGTRLYSISGHINRPGIYELPLGFPLRRLIEEVAGGMKDGKKLKAVIPGGSSCPLLTANEIDVNMDYDSVAKIGSMLGSGGTVIFDEDTCMVDLARRIMHFYAHESCGWCIPCREGTAWLRKMLDRFHDGGGNPEDIDLISELSQNILGRSFCPLGDAAALPTISIVKKWRNEFEDHLQGKCLSSPPKSWQRRRFEHRSTQMEQMPGKEIKFSLDGREITTAPGTLVIEAAKQQGIEVPSFCYYPGLSLQAACRMCLVEVEKMPKLQTACTLVATEGMVVKTDTPQVHGARKNMIEFLLSNHPLDCPVCDKGGECELQDMTFRYGLDKTRFIEEKLHTPEEKWSPLVYYDAPRCILCFRCVRVCDEGMDVKALGVGARGVQSVILPNKPGELACEECGMCIDICPVGALTSGTYRYQTRPWEMTYVPEPCTHCSNGCKTTLSVRNNEILRANNRDHSGFNGEFLCGKGRFGHEFTSHPERIRQPLVRRNGKLEPASWEDALEEVRAPPEAGSFHAWRVRHRRDRLEPHHQRRKLPAQSLCARHARHQQHRSSPHRRLRRPRRRARPERQKLHGDHGRHLQRRRDFPRRQRRHQPESAGRLADSHRVPPSRHQALRHQRPPQQNSSPGRYCRPGRRRRGSERDSLAGLRTRRIRSADHTES